MEKKYPLVFFIQGPTATGKTDLAISLAQKLGGEIIGCDSVQVYQEVDIGTAKPTIKERTLVKHHLVDIVPAGETYTAADYRQAVLEILEKNEKVGQIYYIVGGTGFYFLALEKGMYDVPDVPEEIEQSIAQAIAQGESGALYQELLQKDSAYAQKIGQHDHYRLQRALGLIRTLGISMSEIHEKFSSQVKPFPYPLCKIGLTASRDKLRLRVEQRTQKMLEMGLIEEVQRLRQQGLGDWSPLKSVGYKETNLYLDRCLKREDLQKEIVTHTMQLAKRQMTWFKRDLEINWFNCENEMEKAQKFAEEQIAKFL